MFQPELSHLNKDKERPGSPDNDWEAYLAKSSEKDLDRIVQRKIQVIEKPWTHTVAKSGRSIQGFLYKKRKSSSGYRKYWFALNGNQLYYYTTSSTSTVRGIISISFISREIPTTQKILEEVAQGEVSSTYIIVFSPKGMDTFVAPNDDEMMRWTSALQTVCQECLGVDEYQNREQAVEELLPVLAKKSDNNVQKLMRLMHSMDVAGFFPKKKRIKAGKLDLRLESGEWAKLFFAIQGGVLYYYKSANDPPKGMISLKFSNMNTVEDPDMKACFVLENPLAKFVLRGKHEVAVAEWMRVIRSVKEGVDKAEKNRSLAKKKGQYGLLSDRDEIDFDDLSDLKTDEESGSSDDDVYYAFGKRNRAVLHYKFPAEKDLPHRKFVLPLGITNIGRSKELSQLIVKDSKVSRQHAKLEVTEDRCVFSDLGSDHGSKINKKTATMHTLRNGDKFKLGKTCFSFKVKPIRHKKR